MSAARGHRELFEVFRPSDRKKDAASRETPPKPSRPPETPPPAPPGPVAPRKTLWEELSSSRAGQVTFTLNRTTVLIALLVFVLLLAVAFALGRRTARPYYIAQGLSGIVDITPSSPAPVTPPGAPLEALTVPRTSGYAVQLITYEKPKWSEEAKELVNTLRAQGYPSFARDLKEHVVVYVGLFATREEAEKHQKFFRTYKIGGKEPFRDNQLVQIKPKQ